MVNSIGNTMSSGFVTVVKQAQEKLSTVAQVVKEIFAKLARAFEEKVKPLMKKTFESIKPAIPILIAMIIGIAVIIRNQAKKITSFQDYRDITALEKKESTLVHLNLERSNGPARRAPTNKRKKRNIST